MGGWEVGTSQGLQISTDEEPAVHKVRGNRKPGMMEEQSCPCVMA